MIFVYAIKSISHNFIYVGMTEKLEERIAIHFSTGFDAESTLNFAEGLDSNSREGEDTLI